MGPFLFKMYKGEAWTSRSFSGLLENSQGLSRLLEASHNFSNLFEDFLFFLSLLKASRGFSRLRKASRSLRFEKKISRKKQMDYPYFFLFLPTNHIYKVRFVPVCECGGSMGCHCLNARFLKISRIRDNEMTQSSCVANSSLDVRQ